MADAAAARREARRAKILSSGQDRLSRLTNTYQGLPVDPLPSAQSLPPPSPVPSLTSSASVTSSASASHVPSTPPPASSPVDPAVLRHRATASTTRAAPQSPSVARTPLRGPSELFPPSMTDFADPGEEEDMEGMMRRIQLQLQQQQLAAFAGGELDDPPSTSMARGSPDATLSTQPTMMVAVRKQNPLPVRLLSLLRFLTVSLLALLTVRSLAIAAADRLDSWDEDVDLDVEGWTMWARRTATLATTSLDEGSGGAVFRIGEAGTWVSAWTCFLTLQVVLQTIGFAIRQVQHPIPNANASASADPLAAMLGGAGGAAGGLDVMGLMGSLDPRIGTVLRVVEDYRSVWQNLVQDLGTFVFVIGSCIALAVLVQ
ncbi:hypothetical protein HKX48_000696 [Thoreauomyces humboldtii]|nr:hypothetical protein HKX48_000696 [Thoreauomyces humboldtii]